MTLAHLLYIPACILVGIIIGHQFGKVSAREEMEKQQRIEKARKKRKDREPTP